MTEIYKSVGWAIIDGDSVKRPKVHARWYDKKLSARPAKIYKTEAVAVRYGKPVEVFIKVEQ